VPVGQEGAKLDRTLGLEIVRVTEATAIAAARLRGRGDEAACDTAAISAMYRELGRLPIKGVIVVGEVGLAGEVRNVTGVPRRVAEAERMGFRQAIVPSGSAGGAGWAAGAGMEVTEVEDVRQALRAAFRG